MEPNALAAEPKLRLPSSVTGPTDLGRLIRELAAIDDALLQLGLRGGGKTVGMPKTSRLMDQLAELNGLNLLQAEHRQALKGYLATLAAKAPVLKMSFSVDPPPAFVEKLIDWLRREIHPEALLTIGLQPTLGAGCVLRTNSRYFDLSLRQSFANKQELLMAELKRATAPAAALPAEEAAI